MVPNDNTRPFAERFGLQTGFPRYRFSFAAVCNLLGARDYTFGEVSSILGAVYRRHRHRTQRTQTAVK